VKGIVQTLPGAINVSTSKKPVPLEFNISFDPAKLSLYNLTLPQVGAFMRIALDGNEDATKIYKGTDEIYVKTRYTNNSVDTLDKIKNLKIKNNKGQYVFL
jgi:multidrug efflux pump subunit AcrB